MRAVPLVGVLAALPRQVPAVAMRARDTWIVGTEPDGLEVHDGARAMKALAELGAGWWAGFLSYDLGRVVERVPAIADDDLGLPDLALARFDTRLVLPDRGRPRIDGHGAGRKLLARALERAAGVIDVEPPALARWEPGIDRRGYEARVAAALELIRAGECYQVNLTRRLRARPSDALGLFASICEHNPAPHAAFARLPGATVVSASPERFLRRSRRSVETRPIKGTAPEPGLAASDKDRAENIMIVDLARNDLGRVCEYGSVHVDALCREESHPGLHHLVSTVRGRLRSGVGLDALVAATFPPASVTGAPKPRVLRAIEDLEPVRRGVYCGAVGWIDTATDRCDLSVAIRTFTLAGGATHLGVGGGVVADSTPAGEWAETELKARRLLAAARVGAAADDAVRVAS